MFRNWLWLALLLAILFGGRAEALQTENDSAAQDERRPAVIQETPCVYTGPRPAIEVKSPGKVYREQLAELDLLVKVDRDFAEAERRLSVLRLRAMGPPAFDGQREVVVLATERLAEVQLAQRAPERALATAENLLTRRAPQSLEADEWFTPANEEWIELEREWLADPRLISMRKLATTELERRHRAPEIAVTSVPPDVTEEIWRDIQEGDGGLVEAMGSAAVPALEQLVLQSIDGVQASAVADPQRDPLTWLMEIAPERALELMAQRVEVESVVWRKRVLRAMNRESARWSGRSEYEARKQAALVYLRIADWQAILDAYVSDLSLWEDTRDLLGWNAEFMEWSPAQERVVSGLLLDGRADHFALIAPAGSGPFRWFRSEGERRLLRAALLDPRPEVRHFAAENARSALDFLGALEGADEVVRHSFAKRSEELSRRGEAQELDSETRDAWIDAMVSLMQDPSVGVRRPIAKVLSSPQLRELVSPDQLSVIVDDEDPVVRQTIFDRFDLGNSSRRMLDEGEFGLLRAMLDDPSADIRFEVLGAEYARGKPTRFSAEELAAVARDASPKVRGALAWLELPDDASRTSLYAQLAGDADADVVQAVDSKVQNLLREDKSRILPLMPYFEARVNNLEQSMFTDSPAPRGPGYDFLQTAPGLEIVARYASAHRDPRAVASIVWTLVNQLRQPSDQPAVLAAQFVTWPAEVLAYVLKTSAELPGKPDAAGIVAVEEFRLGRLMEELQGRDDPQLEKAMLQLSQDASAQRVIRLYAFAWRMQHRPETSTDELMAFLSAPIWDGVTLKEPSLREALRQLALHIHRDVRNAVALRIVQTPEIERLVATEVTDHYLPDEPGGIEVSRAMVAHWLDQGTSYSPAGAALRHLGAIPGEVDPALLRHALRNTNLRDVTLGVLAKLKDPQYLPDLRDCLNPTWIGYAETRHRFAKDTAFTISQYMTDEAAEVLLEGVGIAENEEVRQACFDALERIRLYQEARERLGRHSSGAEKREQAVQDLVALLDDKDTATVVAAIRGLAALGAVDELPKLIRLMKHADEDVSAAARDAVMRLTEPAPKSDGSDAQGD